MELLKFNADHVWYVLNKIDYSRANYTESSNNTFVAYDLQKDVTNYINLDKSIKLPLESEEEDILSLDLPHLLHHTPSKRRY